jgi:hypothetical protein
MFTCTAFIPLRRQVASVPRRRQTTGRTASAMAHAAFEILADLPIGPATLMSDQGALTHLRGRLPNNFGAADPSAG